MDRKKGFTLQLMVSVLVILSGLTTLAASMFIAYRNEKKSLTRITLEMNKINSDRIADSVDGLFFTMKTSLSETARYLMRKQGQTDVSEMLNLFLLNHPDFNSVSMVNENGILLHSSAGITEMTGQKVESVGVAQALREKRPLVSEPYMSVGNRLIVLVSEPLFDENGTYRGFLGASIRLQEQNLLSKMITGVPSGGSGSYVFVVSSSGYILYHPDRSRIGENGSENVAVQDLMAGKSGAQRLVNTRGIDMLASYTALKGLNWGVVSQTPTNAVLSDSKKQVLGIALYTIPVMLVVIIIIYYLIGKVSEPLVKLARFASRLSYRTAADEPFPRIHDWNYEANKLYGAMAIAVNHVRHEYDNLLLEAHTDPLTGLFNRRVMDHYIQVWMAEKVPFCLLILDLDHFKQVNDTYGHDAGDEVLRAVAQTVRANTRREHVCCRFGGEEYVVLMPGTTRKEAAGYAETIRLCLEQSASPIGRPVTVSVGLAAYPDSAVDSEVLFRLADEALYKAKRAGRNRVESN
ncbi:diguanylate cyclase [Paenibacillus mesophilus]|uniref:sensor domain-containing diguanylate cyclase n=1 Tax=Paenibacillus mesophilus TaxID=2582849 RepID=UPI00110D8EBA|nr:sensor domain-containing diguanylate cyclase [Paenibacillus mesophilus]TMV48457.1 diguanylate cyclase [Paenibacillus mesophilus]